MKIDLDDVASLPEAFFKLAEVIPERWVYSFAEIEWDGDKEKRRLWKGRTYTEVAKRVQAIAAYLKSIGAEPGTKIAILSQSRAEWMEADIAIGTVAGVTVSVYQTLPEDDVGYILFDSEADIVFAENEEQLDKLNSLIEHGTPIPETPERDAQHAKIALKKIICFEAVEESELVITLDSIFSKASEEVVGDYKELTREDLASFVYTSGTTGPPKGVMQTHGNHLANARQVWRSGVLKNAASIMIFLPLAHSFAKLMGNLCFCSEIMAVFPAVPDRKSSKLVAASVTRDIREGQSSLLPIVPRLLEKMQSGILAKAKGKGLSQRILSLTLWAAREVYKAEQKGLSGTVLAQLVFVATAGVRRKVKVQLFGDEFMYAISGGAKLNREVGHFFKALEIDILEGYGLTETCVATNLNPPGRQKIGTVGPVLDTDVEIKLTEDQEICFRGPNVAKGYYKREKATAESWDADGWFHTGDLGSIDSEGFLSIVGRKKDIIVTSYGKNIAPDHVQGVLQMSPYVSQAVLVGNDRAYCVALLTIDKGALKKARPELLADGEFSTNDKLSEFVKADLKNYMHELANYETPKKFAILDEEFSVENGFLTPTFKVKKKKVLEVYHEQIESLYSD